MNAPLLYYITDGSRLGKSLLEKIGSAFAAGLDYLQIREKHLTSGELFRLASAAAALPRNGKLLVNDRLDVALASRADGMHLPAGRPPAARFRALTPGGFLIGVSCHSTEEVERAAGEGADFAVLGPIFSSPGKGAPLGLPPLETAARSAIPIFALGGVTLENACLCLRAGARGVAGIRVFQDAPDISAVVKKLKEMRP